MSAQKLTNWSSRWLEIDHAWSELNRALAQTHLGHGLDAAFLALAAHQTKAGFIQDNLDEVIRYRLVSPLDPSQFYSSQYNPQRALRFGGFGRREPPVEEARVHQGCFLCRDNIFWQHEGRQLGMDLKLGESHYVALTNPFPLMPLHLVIAARNHVPQRCDLSAADGPEKSLDTVLHHVLTLASQLPDFVVFYNGVDAGATIPHHLHFQTFARPQGYDLFPLEQRARRHAAFPCWVEDYPLQARIWRGTMDGVRQASQDWIHEWVQRNEAQAHHLSANLIATQDEANPGHFYLYFVPRTRQSLNSEQASSVNIGGLEVLGELVFTDNEIKQQLDSGLLDYHAVEHILSSVGSVTAASFPNP
ncbi:MAG: DUF4922 domain-containing protein [Magnetococcales bacterium]|nr:DUF4922 domain-containing protein [Magnetococcales bacterium]